MHRMDRPWLRATSPGIREGEMGVVEANETVAPESGIAVEVMTVEVVTAEVGAAVAMQILVSMTAEASNSQNTLTRSYIIFSTFTPPQQLSPRSNSRQRQTCTSHSVNNSNRNRTLGVRRIRSVKDTTSPASHSSTHRFDAPLDHSLAPQDTVPKYSRSYEK